MYVTLDLDNSGCRIHSISDDDIEIVTDERYMVMWWSKRDPQRHGANVTLKEAVEEVKKHEEDRKLVSKFEAKHRDEIEEILGVIDYLDKGYVKERFPKVYKFGCKRLGVHFEN